MWLRRSGINGAKHAAAVLRILIGRLRQDWPETRFIVRRDSGFCRQDINPRFVVTNLDRPAPSVDDQLNCARDEAENRIKQTQLDMFGTRASCHKSPLIVLPVMLAAMAYPVMQRLLQPALTPTPKLARATAATIRTKLIKIATAVIRNSRRVRILFALNHPMRALFARAAFALAP